MRSRASGDAGPGSTVTGNLRREMATADEHRTIAPIVGPDDPRRFTDSGIEIKPAYDEQRSARRPRAPARRARRVPVHARDPPRHVPQAAVDDAPVRGLREREGVQRALPLPALEGLDGPLDGVRPADPARPRLRRPALPRRGRPHRRRDRHDRRHADRVRPDPARPGLDLDDDQRAGERAAAPLRAGRRGAGRRAPSSCAARPRTTSSRSTSRAGTTSIRPRARSG